VKRFTPKVKRSLIFTVIFVVISIVSYSVPVWNYLYESGKYIEVKATVTTLSLDENGRLVKTTAPLPTESIHMAWTPLYLFAKEVRAITNHSLGSFDDVPNIITMIQNVFSYMSASIAVFRAILTFSYLNDNTWYRLGDLNFRRILSF